jgi:hypothetical protein
MEQMRHSDMGTTSMLSYNSGSLLLVGRSKSAVSSFIGVFALLFLLCAARPDVRAEGMYLQSGLLIGAVIINHTLPIGGLIGGAGYTLPLGAGELSLGVEMGLASTGSFAAIPAAVSAAYDFPLSQNFSMGGGLLTGGFFVLDKNVQMSPLFGGRVRAALKGPDKFAGVYIAAGMDVAPETTGVALLPVCNLGLRLWPLHKQY